MRISIVEENQTLLENLRLLLTGEPNCEIVGAFSSAEDAIPAIHNNPPEVLLTDLAFPGMSGVELIGNVKQKYPEIDVMAHTVSESRESVFSAIKAGASAYILKGSRPVELIEALNELYEGGAPMSPKIARMVIQEFQDKGNRRAVSPEPARERGHQGNRKRTQLQGNGRQAEFESADCPYTHQKYLQKTPSG